MGILNRFLIFFGASFLSLAVILFSFLRKKIANHTKRERRRRAIERRKKQFSELFRHK
jgi:hypothetical protein